MPAKNHYAYQEELDRCSYTLALVEKTLEDATEKKQRIDSYLEKVKKHFNAESSQDYIDMIVNTALQSSMDLKLRNLITARSKPYFARIDFCEKEKDRAEKLYIGKMCLTREEDQELIIVDWRAPVANLYYEGRLGNAAYTCPDGLVNGELQLKRQFSINGGVLQEISDIDIATNDEFLQSHLGANADNRLKDIVSTIQAEQNRIIRADMWTPLIVQGAAGSGKTTIALHRIAYLIYNFEKSFKPENFTIIAPNRLFLNYISEVLPELGVEKVKQTTFEALAMEIIKKNLKIKDPMEKLEAFVNWHSAPELQQKYTQMKRASRIKSSMLYKEILDGFIRKVEESFLPPEDFRVGNIVVFKREEISRLFLKDYGGWPIMHRMAEIKKYLTNRLKTKKEAIINHLQDECDRKIMDWKLNMKDSEERQKLIIEAIDRKNSIIGNLEKYSKKAINEYIGKLPKLNPLQYYKAFINEYLGNRELETEKYKELYGDEPVDAETLAFISTYTSGIMKSGYVEIEDLAPMMYLKYNIDGLDEKFPVKHIVIDEAQDFSVLQLYVLKKIIKDSSFTILGDLCQGIHGYRGISRWQDLMDHVFAEGRSKLLTLEQSYRTTVEIMEAANKVMQKLKNDDLVQAKPVLRHGDRPLIIKKSSLKDIAADMEVRIPEMKKLGFKSIAIIGKTLDECREMHACFKNAKEDISLITGKEDAYKGGIVIVPSYLAKGLEFDVVMIANANDEEYIEDELDIKLLYVCMTRPLHQLYIYYKGEASCLLQGI